jgi:molybdopterin-guanine dinucleotide biosynthesis protein A
MGRDKAGLPWRGEPLLAHVARVCAATGIPVTVVGRERPEDWSGPDVRFVADRSSGLGPLGGVVTALSETGGPVLAVACDLPLLTTKAVQWLVDAASASALDWGVVTVTDRPQPLFAVYTQQALVVARERAEGGDLSLMGLIRTDGFALIDAPASVAYALANANTPEEWRALSGSGED